MFALPTRLGGLRFEILPEVADQLYSAARKLAEPLMNSIRSKEGTNETQIDAEQGRLAKSVQFENKEEHQRKAEAVRKEVSANERKALSLVEQKGLSSWLNTLPVEEHGFSLHKGAFCDAIALRYRWRPTGMPNLCVCGKANGVEHALSCCKGDMSSNITSTLGTSLPHYYKRSHTTYELSQ